MCGRLNQHRRRGRGGRRRKRRRRRRRQQRRRRSPAVARPCRLTADQAVSAAPPSLAVAVVGGGGGQTAVSGRDGSDGDGLGVAEELLVGWRGVCHPCRFLRVHRLLRRSLGLLLSPSFLALRLPQLHHQHAHQRQHHRASCRHGDEAAVRAQAFVVATAVVVVVVVVFAGLSAALCNTGKDGFRRLDPEL